jgi:four helix bundle protein
MAGWTCVDEIVAYRRAVRLRDLVIGLIDSGAIPHNYRLREDLAAAARSVPDNISEGFDLYSHGLFGHHVAIARGSLGELGTQLEEIHVRGFTSDTQHTELIHVLIETRRTTAGLLRHLRTTEAPPPWNATDASKSDLT